jgi:hypothetical protein
MRIDLLSSPNLQLGYIRPVSSGWFGRILVSLNEALGTISHVACGHVPVQTLSLARGTSQSYRTATPLPEVTLGTIGHVACGHVPVQPPASLVALVNPTGLQHPSRKLHLDAHWPPAQS